MSAAPDSTLFIGEIDDVVWVRVEGRGTFQNSPDLKAVAAHAASHGKSRMVVDLLNTPIMDSTFMGTLTGLALGLRDRPGGGLLVVNANQRNVQLLENLGLDQIFEVDKDGTALPEIRRSVEAEIIGRGDRVALDKSEHAAHVLEAHEALAEANPANRERFRDVVSFLKSEVEGDPGNR
jgi:anti-anti-sigma regulatory factor